MSFVDTLNNLKTTLESNANLQAFCQEKWGKALTVKKVFKQRSEVLIGELPIVLITRPERRSEEGLVRRKDNTHTVRLYAGFHQPDREKALDETIGLEEAIDNAVMADNLLGGTAAGTSFTSSQNDEGLFHPVYFQVIDFDILKRA
jgi:hypothetical protein